MSAPYGSDPPPARGGGKGVNDVTRSVRRAERRCCPGARARDDSHEPRQRSHAWISAAKARISRGARASDEEEPEPPICGGEPDCGRRIAWNDTIHGTSARRRAWRG